MALPSRDHAKFLSEFRLQFKELKAKFPFYYDSEHHEIVIVAQRLKPDGSPNDHNEIKAQIEAFVQQFML